MAIFQCYCYQMGIVPQNSQRSFPCGTLFSVSKEIFAFGEKMALTEYHSVPHPILRKMVYLCSKGCGMWKA